jgi:hypothetical protein
MSSDCCERVALGREPAPAAVACDLSREGRGVQGEEGCKLRSQMLCNFREPVRA